MWVSKECGLTTTSAAVRGDARALGVSRQGATHHEVLGWLAAEFLGWTVSTKALEPAARICSATAVPPGGRGRRGHGQQEADPQHSVWVARTGWRSAASKQEADRDDRCWGIGELSGRPAEQSSHCGGKSMRRNTLSTRSQRKRESRTAVVGACSTDPTRFADSCPSRTSTTVKPLRRIDMLNNEFRSARAKGIRGSRALPTERGTNRGADRSTPRFHRLVCGSRPREGSSATPRQSLREGWGATRRGSAHCFAGS